MSNCVLAIAGLMGGWCFCSWLLVRGLPAAFEASVTYQDRMTKYKNRLGVAIVFIVMLMLGVLALEDMSYQQAFSVEETITGDRTSIVLLFISLGLFSRLYK